MAAPADTQCQRHDSRFQPDRHHLFRSR
jgi:hypothetical protein